MINQLVQNNSRSHELLELDNLEMILNGPDLHNLGSWVPPNLSFKVSSYYRFLSIDTKKVCYQVLYFFSIC